MLAEFSIIPVDKGMKLGKYVSQILDLVDQSGLDYMLCPMGTLVEGDREKVWELIRSCHEKMASFSDRVLTTVRIDDKKGATGQIQAKTASVERNLGRPLTRTP